MQTESMMHIMVSDGGGITFLVTFLMVSENLFLLCLEKLDTFEMIVLRRQEELVGPSQHNTIRNTCSQDSPAIFMTKEQD